jgi:decaprenylphospho-beta-D-erythro-pentofuranosid-2-ulose 2-reductase
MRALSWICLSPSPWDNSEGTKKLPNSAFGHALVIGASSGIGEQLARRLAANGTRVALVARREAELQRVMDEINAAAGEDRAVAVAHDVRATADVPELFQEITRVLGGLDLVIYAAGVMAAVGEDEYDTDKDREMMEINLLGAVAWLNLAAGRFARLERGTIVGIGSVAGDRGRAGNPGYCTSKAAFHAYLEALRNRVARLGVRVVTIKPGFVDTVMTRGKEGLFWVISADRAAEIILAKARRGVVVAYVPARWRLVMSIIRSVPSFIFSRLGI